jgi:hypothetical protein
MRKSDCQEFCPDDAWYMQEFGERLRESRICVFPEAYVLDEEGNFVGYDRLRALRSREGLSFDWYDQDGKPHHVGDWCCCAAA